MDPYKILMKPTESTNQHLHLKFYIQFMKTMNFILRTCDLRTFLERCIETVNLVVPERRKWEFSFHYIPCTFQFCIKFKFKVVETS